VTRPKGDFDFAVSDCAHEFSLCFPKHPRGQRAIATPDHRRELSRRG
jgi:hypothetical protein